MNLKRTVKRKWGPDMTELTLSGGKAKNWKVGPEGNDREPYKTREARIGQGGLGVTTSLRGKSWNSPIWAEQATHPWTRLVFVLDFTSRLLERGENPFGKALGVRMRGEGDLAREFCFLFLSFYMFFCFPLKIIFLIWIRILICTISVNKFLKSMCFWP